MKKNSNKTVQPETQIAAGMNNEEAMSDAANVSPISAGKGTRRNLFNEAATRVSEQVQLKMQTLGDARQKLAEAADLFAQGGDSVKEGRKRTAEAGVKLYQARIAGAITGDELSGLLRDTFGCRKKGESGTRVSVGDADASATPFGEGEAVRKRVVRAVQAHEYGANDGDGGKFFDGMPRDKVAALVNNMENGKLSLYTIYDDLGKLKNETASKRINPAFDPKRVAGMVEALGEEGAVDIIVGNPALQLAYGELLNMLHAVGEKAATVISEAKAA